MAETRIQRGMRFASDNLELVAAEKAAKKLKRGTGPRNVADEVPEPPPEPDARLSLSFFGQSDEKARPDLEAEERFDGGSYTVQPTPSTD